MPTRTRPLALAAALLGAAALAGCTREANDSLVLGTDIVPAAFAEPPHDLPDPGPSVQGLDRSNWAPLVYIVPVNGVAHPPTYAPPTFALDALPRQRGEYPTALTALDLGDPRTGEDVVQALRSQGQAVLDAALLLPRMVIRPPNATDWSPRRSYERAPAPVITADWSADQTVPPAVATVPPAPAPDPENELALSETPPE